MTSPGGKRRASVSDVAQLAGVSMGTVSNVLNRPEAVSEATRTKVERAIALLKFVPSGAARQLRAGRATTVGCIVLDIRNPFFTDVARGVEDRLAEDDLALMLASSDDDPGREAKFLRIFEEHGVVGILVVPTGRDTDRLYALRERGMRIVLLDAPAPSPEFSSVSVDDIEGGALAVEHLLAGGHRTVTMFNGPHSVRQCADRRAGADRAALAHGLDPSTAIREVTLPSLDAGGGEAALTSLAESDGVPTAMFCVNDLVAIGVQRALRKLGGYEALAAVAMVGYDDIEVAAELAHPLTSIHQPRHEMGYRAAELLARRSDRPEQIVLHPTLVVRESSSPSAKP